MRTLSVYPHQLASPAPGLQWLLVKKVFSICLYNYNISVPIQTMLIAARGRCDEIIVFPAKGRALSSGVVNSITECN